MTINKMGRDALVNGIDKGFVVPGVEPDVHCELLMVVGELTEAQNELRDGRTTGEIYFKDGKPEGFPIELADAAIRIGRLATQLNIDLEGAVEMKMAYNATRPFMHGGKKF